MPSKSTKASLRYIVAMAFARTATRIFTSVLPITSAAASASTFLIPGVVADTAMLIKVNKEIDKIVAADYPLKRGDRPQRRGGQNLRRKRLPIRQAGDS
jgi:hypothetical protein